MTEQEFDIIATYQKSVQLFVWPFWWSSHLIKNFASGQQQAFEACIQDAVSYMNLFSRAQEHANAALLFNGLIANASMFVVESHQCLITLFPEFRDVLSQNYIDLLYASRHRAKLLDHAAKTIEEVTGDLVTIAKDQRRLFLEPHSGFLGPIKKALQRDMGLSIYNGHIFTTTHSTIFEFGGDFDLTTKSLAFGEAIGFYTASLLSLFSIEIPPSVEPADLPGKFEMRDIKYEALYNRGQLGATRMDFSAGLILILANLNFAYYILPGLLPSNSHALFRMKFITAFHANININSMQGRLMANKLGDTKIVEFFRKALGNSDSRWLRKQRRLRNLLTHYLPDAQMASDLQVNATRMNAIERIGGGLSFEEINALLNRNIGYLSGLLESGFNLAGDPYWLGKIK
jgi:hypothetical protein